jgi:hypothetical protein
MSLSQQPQWSLSANSSDCAVILIFLCLIIGGPKTFARNVFTYDPNGNLLSQQTTTALTAPTIIAGPQNAHLTSDGTAEFTVTAAGGGPLSYQWRVYETPLPGATQDTLTLVQLPLNEPSYFQIDVVVSNSAGSVTSAAVTILPDSNGNDLPDAWEQQYFSNLLQSPDGDFDADGVSNRDEWRDGTNPALNTSHHYGLLVKSPGGQVSRSPAALRYAPNQTVTLSATPEADNFFINWSVTNGGSSAANPVALTMTADTTITARMSSLLVRGWGNNVQQQLLTPPSLSDSVFISAGQYHGLVLRSTGLVEGWGLDTSGQATVPDYGDAVGVSAGGTHSLLLRANGTVLAWGDNASGQCTVPQGLSGVVAVSAGGFHSAALRSDGSVWCWGSNQQGQCAVPATLFNAVQVSAGANHTLALLSDGRVMAWGDNTNQQLNVPAGLNGVVAISAGGYHNLALKSDGTVVAWGLSLQGQTTVPAGLSLVAAVSAGGYHSVGLKVDGTLVSWGSSTSGQTTPPVGIGSVAQVSAGTEFTVGMASSAIPQRPQVVGSLRWLATAGRPFQTRLAARHGAVSYAVNGLPAGLSLQPSTGLISGSATQAGTYELQITATNASGISEPLYARLEVNPLVITFTSPPHFVTSPNVAWTYTATANYPITAISAANLPAGVSLNASTRTLSGTLANAGLYTVDLQATTTEGPAAPMSLTIACVTTGGAANWFTQTTVTPDGAPALQSGDISSNQASVLQTQVTGPGTLNFTWKVSSESGFDFLEFLINGVEQPGNISGLVDWQGFQQVLGSGQHVLQWRYRKDGSTSANADTGWVSQIRWAPTPTTATFTNWQAQHFNSAQLADPLISGPLADPDRDGHSNLIEYAMGLSPTSHSAVSQFMSTQMSGPAEQERLRLSLRVPDPLPTGVSYLVQGTDDLNPSNWDFIAVGDSINGWSGVNPVTQDTPSGGYRMIHVSDSETQQTSTRRFMRMQVLSVP